MRSPRQNDGLTPCSDAEPLVSYCDRHELPLAARLALFAQVCEAVTAAHRRGVIHRDLKPANILVDSDGIPHVLDFGLARFTDPELEITRTISAGQGFVGTLPYMSPEQTRGDASDLDIRTDVYSLGVILYELLTGRYPYEVIGQMADVLRNIAEAEPTRPSVISRQSPNTTTCQGRINDEVETMILHALAKDRDRRYPSAEALGRDVRCYLTGEPIEAKRDRGGYVLRKLAARHRYAAAVVGLLVLIVVGFSAASVQFILWERDANRELRQTRDELQQQVQAKSEIASTAVDVAQRSATSARQAWLESFLLLWHRGLTHEVGGELVEGSREATAVQFLLDPRPLAAKIDAFHRQLDADAPEFVEFVIAEHRLRDGNRTGAAAGFRRVAAALGGRADGAATTEPRLLAWVTSRLEMLGTDAEPAK